MKKPLAYLSLLLIAGAIVGADAWILTRGGALAAYARRELDRLTGGALKMKSVSVSLDGTVVLEGVELSVGKARAFEAARAEVALEGGRPARVKLRDLRLRLSDALFEELKPKGDSKGTIRDLFPTPADLPRIEIEGGTVEVDVASLLAHPQAIVLGRVTATAAVE